MNGTGKPIYKFSFEEVEVDERHRELRVQGLPVDLEPKPMAVLLALLTRPGEVVTREELLAGLWDGRITVPNVLANAISKIRDALGDTAGKRVITVPRVGYRFEGSLVRELVGRTTPPNSDGILRAGLPVPGRENSYVLVEQLGTETRHPVWRAKHVRLDETKVFKFATDGDLLASLKREFTLTRYLISALGDKTAISAISDTNFSELPFFLEFPDFGEDLFSWSNHASRWLNLNLEERLDIFVRVAGFVASAHALGVLHKDIKPENVLIREIGVSLDVRLSDFGSGRVENIDALSALHIPPVGLTVSDLGINAERSGTWIYMAPEVQRGQPYTVAADVYALGLLLFQLVVRDLRRSLSSDWRRWVDDLELQADIEAATAGDPLARIGSAQALCDSVTRRGRRRLERQLELERSAAVARAQRNSDRIKARRPWVMLSFFLLAGALGVVSVLAYQTRNALVATERAENEASAISAFLLTDVLRAADMTRAEAGAMPSANLTSVLHRAAARAGDRFAQQPAIEARIRTQLGESLERASDPGAEAEIDRALALYQAHPEWDPRAATDARLVHATMLARKHRVTEATRAMTHVNGYFTANPLTANSAASDRMLWARKHYADQAIAWAGHDYPAALAAAQAYRATLLALPNIALPEQHSSLLLLAEALSRTGRLKEASRTYVQATQAPFLPETIGPHAWTFTKSRQSLQELQSGDLDASQASLNAAKSVFSKLADKELNLAYDLDVGQAYIHEMKGHLAEAAKAYTEAIKAALRAHGPQSPITHSVQSNAAIMQSYVGQPAAAMAAIEAEQRWLTQHAEREGVVGSPFGMSLLEFHRALLLTDLGRPEDALHSLQSLSGQTLAAEDAAKGWAARLRAEIIRAKIAIRPSGTVREQLLEVLADLKREGAPEWVISRYEKLR